MKKLFGKILSVLTAAVFALSLAACGEKRTTVGVYMPDGAPAVALSAFMANGYENTEFTVVASSAINGVVSGGSADMAIMPINAAAKMYNDGEDIVMLSVNTHGNLYIVGDGTTIALSDLVGKRLGVIGMGNIPDQVLRMLLDGTGIEYEISDTAVAGKVALRYAADGGKLLPLLGAGEVDYALLAEPAATTAVNKLKKSIVLDMQAAWKNEFGFEYPQACLVARGEFVDDNKAYVDKFLDDLKARDDYAVREPEKAFEAIKSHMADGTQTSLTVLNAGIAERCNIRTDFADDAKINCNQYFALLIKLQSGTGATALEKIPDDGFYYGK